MSGCYREVGSSRIEPMDRSLLQKGMSIQFNHVFSLFPDCVGK